MRSSPSCGKESAAPRQLGSGEEKEADPVWLDGRGGPAKSL